MTNGVTGTTGAMGTTTAPTTVPGVTKVTVNLEEIIAQGTQQVPVDEMFTVPAAKPDVDRVLNVTTDVQNVTTEVLTNKIIVRGNIEQRIMYVAALPDQPVHEMHFTTPFTTFVDAPGVTPDTNVTVDVDVTVEHVSFSVIDPRTVKVTKILKVMAKATGARPLTVVTDVAGANTTKQVVNIDSVVGQGTQQVPVDEMFTVPAAKPDVDRVLNVTTDVQNVTTEVLTNKIIVRGNIEQRIMYVAALPDQPVHEMHFTTPFTTFVDAPGVTPDTNVTVSTDVTVERTTFSVIDPRTVKVTKILKVTAKATTAMPIQVVTGVQGAQVTTDTVNISNVVGQGTRQVAVDETLTIPAAKPDADRVLTVTTEIMNITTETIPNKVIVRGNIEQRIMYVAALPDQPVHEAHFTIPFTTFVDVPGVTTDAIVTVDVQVEHAEAKLVDPRTIRVTKILKVTVKATQTQTITVVTDVTGIPSPPPPPTPCSTTYVVQPGDTLSAIANRFGISLAELIAANPQIKDPNLIFPGDVICIPAPAKG